MKRRALDLYVKGRGYWNMRTEQALNLSVEYFQRAIACDPKYLPAYVGLADALNVLVGYGFAPRAEALKKANKQVSKVLGVNDSLAEVHASLAFIHNERLDWEDAEREYLQALTINPDYAVARHWYANFLGEHGFFDEARKQIDQALALDPLSISANGALGAILLVRRDYPAAIHQLRKTLEMAPNLGRVRMVLAEAYVHGGDCKSALQEIDKAATLLGKSAEVRADHGYILAVCGDEEQALKIATQLEQDREPGSAAVVYAGLGKADLACRCLDQARPPLRVPPERVISDLKTDPRFDKVRDDPRFAKIIAAVFPPFLRRTRGAAGGQRHAHSASPVDHRTAMSGKKARRRPA